MSAEEIIESLRAQATTAKSAQHVTPLKDDWKGKELKNCYAKIASLEDELKKVKESGSFAFSSPVVFSF